MKTFDSKHNRISIRLKGYDYSRQGLYFITLCTKEREHLFGRLRNGVVGLSNIGCFVQQCWQDIPKHFPNVVLHAFVIMPDHIHGIIEIVGANVVGANNHSPLRIRPNGTSRTLGSIIRGFKIGVTRLAGFSVWQRNYYEHIVRSANEYERIVEYIIQNPRNGDNKCNKGE